MLSKPLLWISISDSDVPDMFTTLGEAVYAVITAFDGPSLFSLLFERATLSHQSIDASEASSLLQRGQRRDYIIVVDSLLSGLSRLHATEWLASHDGALEGLTNRWSQPLAVVKSTFDLMKQFPMFATFAATSGGSAPSR
jgi:hypothetical protein